MPSAIDSTKPEDGIPAVKAQLRANLAAAKTELDHGGFAEGLTPTNYGPPTGSQVTDHLAAIDTALGGCASNFTELTDTPSSYSTQASQFVKVKADETGLELAPAPGGSGGLTGWTDVKADYGAAGDGVSNDTTALQNALNGGATVVYLPPGTYKITSALVVTPGQTLLGAGTTTQTVIDARTVPEDINLGVIRCVGTTTALPSLSASINEGDRDFSFASNVSSTVQPWDVIAMLDTRNSSWSDRNVVYHDGHMVVVMEIDGTSRIIPASSLTRSLPSPKIGGGTVGDVECVLLDRRGVRFEGFRLDCRGLDREFDETRQTSIGITTRYLANVVVNDVFVRAATTYGWDLDRCALVFASNCKSTGFDGGWTSGGGDYGCIVAGSSFCHLTNSYFAGGRHALDLDKGGSETPLQHGPPSHDNVMNGCTFECPATDEPVRPGSSSNYCFSSHAGAYRYLVANCLILGTTVVRGCGAQFINNQIIVGNNRRVDDPGGSSSMRVFQIDEHGPRVSLTIKGNYVESFLNQTFMRLRLQHLTTAEPEGYIDISDNVIRLYGANSDPVIQSIPSDVQSGKVNWKIHNNAVVSTNGRSFLDLFTTAGTFASASILSNRLGSNMTLGSMANVANDDWRALNMVGAHLQFDNLPTSNPGGAGRLWSDSGTLKIT